MNVRFSSVRAAIRAFLANGFGSPSPAMAAPLPTMNRYPSSIVLSSLSPLSVIAGVLHKPQPGVK
jgi:hypothetical protein